MSDTNQFKPYRYNQEQERYPVGDRGLNLSASRYIDQDSRRRGFLSNPMVMASIGAVGILFLSVVLINAVIGPDDQAEDMIPIVQAQTDPVKTEPQTTAQNGFPNSESTIYQSSSLDEMDQGIVLDLSADPSETAAKLEMLARRAQDMAQTEPAAGDDQPQEIEVSVAPVMNSDSEPPIQSSDAPSQTPSVQPQKTYSAGSSPETLAFVRSVLDNKDQKKTAMIDTTKQDKPVVATFEKVEPAPTKKEEISAAEPTPAAIEPSAGTEGVVITSGAYFVQLASVKDQAGANTEWGKLKSKYETALQDANYRVSRADLEKGTFYRIQAGPMSKESANDVCNAVKSASGSCFVTR